MPMYILCIKICRNGIVKNHQIGVLNPFPIYDFIWSRTGLSHVEEEDIYVEDFMEPNVFTKKGLCK